MDKASREANRASWQRHIEAWESSGLTQAAYCEQAGIKHDQFGYYRKQFSKPKQPKAATLATIKVTSTVSPVVSIQLPNGIQLRLATTLSISELADLARSLA